MTAGVGAAGGIEMGGPRTLPDAERLVCAYLRAGIADATVETRTRDPFARCPYIAVRSTGIGSVPHWRLLRESHVEIVSFTIGERAKGADLAEQVRCTLSSAWQAQTVLPAGHLARVQVVNPATEQRLDGQTDEQFRFTATYRLLIRP